MMKQWIDYVKKGVDEEVCFVRLDANGIATCSLSKIENDGNTDLNNTRDATKKIILKKVIVMENLLIEI